MGIIVGFDAASGARATIITSLLVVAIADNISDSLSIHLYQEAEKLEQRAAFEATLTNFVARLLVVLSFVAWVAVLPARWVVPVVLGWGMSLLAFISVLVARARDASPRSEVAKHLTVAAVVIVLSRLAASAIYVWISP